MCECVRRRVSAGQWWRGHWWMCKACGRALGSAPRRAWKRLLASNSSGTDQLHHSGLTNDCATWNPAASSGLKGEGRLNDQQSCASSQSLSISKKPNKKTQGPFWNNAPFIYIQNHKKKDEIWTDSKIASNQERALDSFSWQSMLKYPKPPEKIWFYTLFEQKAVYAFFCPIDLKHVY